MKQTFKKRNQLLFITYVGLIVAFLLPASGLAFNYTIGNTPIALLWMVGCLICIVLLTFIAYPLVFKHWIEVPLDEDIPQKNKKDLHS